MFGASSAALIVPSAMLAALLVLVLGGGFGSVGVLAQLFAGPSLPGIGAPGGGHVVSGRGVRGFTSASLPVIPAVTPVAGARHAVVRKAPAPTVPSASRGTGTAGGAIGGTGGTVRPVTQGTGASGSGGSGSGGSGSGGSGSSGSPAGSSPGSGSSAPSPQPQPSPSPPQPTPVDTVVKVITSVTQQLPAPVGPVATQTAQAAGSAVDNLLPQTGQP